MSQPPYPRQPHQPGSGQQHAQVGPVPQPYQGSAIKFTVQGNLWTSNLVAPTLTVDGYPAPTATGGGSTVIPVPPGPHRLDVSSQWLRRYGQAAMDVVVPPNSLVEVFYAPPYHQFTTGALGLAEQPRKGLAALVVTLAVVLGLMFALILLVILTA